MIVDHKMAPNRWGACHQCHTLDFECICNESSSSKRELEDKESPCQKRRCLQKRDSETSHEQNDDIISRAMDECTKYGVNWDLFSYKDDKMALRNLIALLDTSTVQFYVGACKSPAQRFFENPSPHMLRYKQLFPLWLGTSAGMIEKQFIKVCREKCGNRIENKSNGGEGIHFMSTRFVYVAIKGVSACA